MKTLVLYIMCVSCCMVANAQYQNISLGDIIEIGGVKGIVFEVDETGSHGKVMSIQALRGVSDMWCNDKKLGNELPPMTDEYDGMANTKKVFDFAEKQNALSSFPVFQWCKQLGEGWYVPALKELEAFVNFWVGNEQTIDWDAEESEETEFALDNNKPYYKTVNKKILEAGGIPFINGVFTSTVNNDEKLYVFWFNREKNSWSFLKKDKNNLRKAYVGRAFHKF